MRNFLPGGQESEWPVKGQYAGGVASGQPLTASPKTLRLEGGNSCRPSCLTARAGVWGLAPGNGVQGPTALAGGGAGGGAPTTLPGRLHLEAENDPGRRPSILSGLLIFSGERKEKKEKTLNLLDLRGKSTFFNVVIRHL